MSRWPGRAIRVAAWVGVGVCVLLIVLAAISMRYRFGVRFAAGGRLMLESGRLILYGGWIYGDLRGLDAPSLFAKSYRFDFDDIEAFFAWPSAGVDLSDVPLVVCPLWVLLLVIGTAAAALAWLARRRPPRGHCRACGYNLTGCPSGRCPECGEPIEIDTGVSAPLARATRPRGALPGATGHPSE